MRRKMSRWIAVAVILAAVLLACGSAADKKDLVLELYDEFDDFDLSLWKHELTLGGGGNWEFQAYANSRTNSYTYDGILYFHPTLLADIIGEDNVKTGWFRYDYWGSQPADLCTGNAFYGCERTVQGGSNYLNPIVSARIRTAESFSFTYGKVEVRAKLPIGDWLWPAIWLLPTDNQYGGWPTSGEIDIMESRGNSPEYPPGGHDKIASTLHWGPTQSQNMWSLTHQQTASENFAEEFHTFGLIWNETYIGTYVDSEDNKVLSVDLSDMSFWDKGGFGNQSNPWRGRNNTAPFDRRFYLTINLAVGGVNQYFPDLENDTKPWGNTVGNAVNQFYDAKDLWIGSWTQDFQIDSVKVWTYKDKEQTEEQTEEPQCCECCSDGGSGVVSARAGGVILLCLLAALLATKI